MITKICDYSKETINFSILRTYVGGIDYRTLLQII